MKRLVLVFVSMFILLSGTVKAQFEGVIFEGYCHLHSYPYLKNKTDTLHYECSFIEEDCLTITVDSTIKECLIYDIFGRIIYRFENVNTNVIEHIHILKSSIYSVDIIPSGKEYKRFRFRIVIPTFKENRR